MRGAVEIFVGIFFLRASDNCFGVTRYDVREMCRLVMVVGRRSCDRYDCDEGSFAVACKANTIVGSKKAVSKS